MIAAKRLMQDFPEDVKFKSVGFSEIEPNAIKAYRAVHGDIENYGDITQIEWEKVPDFDLFTYSSPCQDFSSAGKQMGGGGRLRHTLIITLGMSESNSGKEAKILTL